MRRARRLFASALLALAAPTAAQAHLVSTGVGPFYDGAAHFFLSFEEVLPVVALALLAGLRGPRAARWSVTALAAGWLVGGGAALVSAFAGSSVWTTPALLLVPGVLVATDLRLPLAASAGVAAAAGVWLGLENGAALADPVAILGASTAAGICSLLLAAVVVSLPALWMRVGVRVAGSWLAALGLLALGWALR